MRIAPAALTAVALGFGPSAAAAPGPPASAASPDTNTDSPTGSPAPGRAPDACTAASAAPVDVDRRRRPDPPPRLERGLVEGGVHLGTTLVPTFQRRWLLGADVGLRLSEGVTLELTGSFSPHFGRGNWTATTRTMIEVYKVAPDLAHVGSTYSALARVSPLHGSAGPNDGALFDAYAIFGAGIARYQGDLEAIQCADTPCNLGGTLTAPTTTVGAGVIVGGRRAIATRVELRVTSMALTTEDRTPLRRDDCELRVGASWGGKARRRAAR